MARASVAPSYFFYSATEVDLLQVDIVARRPTASDEI